jgi:hypothetical protein
MRALLLRSVRTGWEHVFDAFGQGRPQATGDLTDALLSVGEAKLGIQAAISVGYDTQALGLMAVAVALAGVDVALLSHLGVLWWLPCLPSRDLWR